MPRKFIYLEGSPKYTWDMQSRVSASSVFTGLLVLRGFGGQRLRVNKTWNKLALFLCLNQNNA